MAETDRKMFLGGRLKRLRRELGHTQTRMATDLGVSPSYLNHLERNQRPMTAQVLLRLAQAYDLDLRAFSGDADKGSEADLQEVFADAMFRDLPIPRHEVTDLIENAPGASEAIVRLYRAFMDQRRRESLGLSPTLSDEAREAGAELTAADWVRDHIQAHRNHFGELDALGEALAAELNAPTHGFESAAANMDAVENPKKNVPIATFFGTLAVAVIYVLSTNVIAGIVPNADLLNSTAPFGLVYAQMFNEPIGRLVMAMMVISCCGATLCWQFTLSRVFKSSAEVGLFPRVFAKVTQKDVPLRGMFIILAVQTLMALMTTNESLSRQFENLVNLAVVTNVFPYILCCLSVHTLLKQEGATKGNRRNIYVLSVFAIIYSCYAIYAAGEAPMIGGAVAIALGYIIYQVAFNLVPALRHKREAAQS